MNGLGFAPVKPRYWPFDGAYTHVMMPTGINIGRSFSP
jgi:hypothetical protein